MNKTKVAIQRIEKFLATGKELRGPFKETIDLITEELKKDNPDLKQYLPALQKSADESMDSLEDMLDGLEKDVAQHTMDIIHGAHTDGVSADLIWRLNEAREYKVWADKYVIEQHGSDLGTLLKKHGVPYPF